MDWKQLLHGEHKAGPPAEKLRSYRPRYSYPYSSTSDYVQLEHCWDSVGEGTCAMGAADNPKIYREVAAERKGVDEPNQYFQTIERPCRLFADSRPRGFSA
ncbi:hypothetical protein B0H16DRAFT_1462981 [Mycena metata]|uniref:Uncharacterized protein n=1 Tax=Mycena metata TaxID=1033252 RepID=A0AAD7IKW0_9AGAR|nr:hypothetical protein B0H16DRAFT_1462981 [Mycena metata]